MLNWSSPFFEFLAAYSKQSPGWEDLPAELLIIIQQSPGFNFFRLMPLPLLIQALSHRSFVHELRRYKVLSSNERLEFLGDSILGLIVSEELFQRFSQEDEGTLSKRRGAMVNQDQLAEFAQVMGLDQLALVGNAEWGRSQYLYPGILSDAFEALLGAIYLDQGMLSARAFLLFTWEQDSSINGKNPFQTLAHFDPKSTLQERAMAQLGEFPTYQSSEIKTDTDSDSGVRFQVDLILNGEVQLSGAFDSKKRGSRELARQALAQSLVEKLAEKLTEKPTEKIAEKNQPTVTRETSEGEPHAH